MSIRSTSTQSRRLPSMTRLLEHPSTANALTRMPRAVVVNAFREVLQSVRSHCTDPVSEEEIIRLAISSAESAERPSLKRAINATGIILHTGLGRAVLCDAARDSVNQVASGHSLLEIEAESGRRGSRQEHVRGLLRELTGAESAFVVNNNAGAVFLCVTALAKDREVIISRGELVEIGGSFRMPDIIRASGAALVEVGTTNKTRLSDFENAVTDRTGLLLRCHPSNFKIVGFSEEASASDLAALGQKFEIPVMDDLGSGAIIDTESLGAGPTSTLRAAVESGCDVITASGDKLLGGPQCGIILGRRGYVDQIAQHPLARALRVDKLTLAALEATLRLYRDPLKAVQQIPTLRYLSRSPQQLADSAKALVKAIGKLKNATVDTTSGESQIGGGSLPGENLPTTCVRIQTTEFGIPIERLSAGLRANDPPVFARIHNNVLLLDPRTVEPEEIPQIARALVRILN